jgi:hypothetical protein
VDRSSRSVMRCNRPLGGPLPPSTWPDDVDLEHRFIVACA